MNHMLIYCCGCNHEVQARLTTGRKIYPHRTDLKNIPFWQCDTCKNYVGCHHKTKHPTTPLGCIPTPEIKTLRKELHTLLDPIWKSGKMQRKELYNTISHEIGKPFHTAEIRTPEDAQTIHKTILKILNEVNR